VTTAVASSRRKRPPVTGYQTFATVDDRFVEGDGIADSGVEELIVVCKVGDVATVDVDVEAHALREGFAEAAFVVATPC
jgi:hypothetical protein